MDFAGDELNLSCPHCSVATQETDVESALVFAQKHQEHTGHGMVIDGLETAEGMESIDEYVVRCERCGDAWSFGNRGDAESFRSDHEDFTDHAPDKEIEVTSKRIEARTIRDLIRSLQDHFQDGVPLHVLFTIAVEEGIEEDAVLAKISQLKDRGEIFEGRDHSFRVV